MAFRFGTPGPDTLTGEASSNVLSGLDGNDRLDASDGADAVFGGDGSDTLFGGAGDDIVDGGGGDDVVVGDRSGGGPAPVGAGGSPGRNLLLGGDGDDTIRGGYGEDTAFGGDGDDNIVGWGFGPPSPSGSLAWAALDGADALWGGGGADVIRGGGGDDRIDGGEGDDTLHGAHGVDTLTGGAGADLFLFGREDLAGLDIAGGVGEGNRDVVTDFRGGEDVLDVSGYRSFFLPAGTPPMEFLGTDPFVDELRPQVRYEVEGGRTIVQIYSPFNAPPDDVPAPPAQATVEIELRGVHGISAEDLILG